MKNQFSEIKNLAARNAVQEAENLTAWIKLTGGIILLVILFSWASSLQKVHAHIQEITQEREQTLQTFLPQK